MQPATGPPTRACAFVGQPKKVQSPLGTVGHCGPLCVQPRKADGPMGAAARKACAPAAGWAWMKQIGGVIVQLPVWVGHAVPVCVGGHAGVGHIAPIEGHCGPTCVQAT